MNLESILNLCQHHVGPGIGTKPPHEKGQPPKSNKSISLNISKKTHVCVLCARPLFSVSQTMVLYYTILYIFLHTALLKVQASPDTVQVAHTQTKAQALLALATSRSKTIAALAGFPSLPCK